MVNLTLTDTGTIYVKGELSFATIVSLWQQGQAIIIQQKEICFDLSGVTHSDSAGLALLLAWYRKAYHLGKRIQFSNLPKQILTMAQVTELENILPLTKSSENILL